MPSSLKVLIIDSVRSSAVPVSEVVQFDIVVVQVIPDGYYEVIRNKFGEVGKIVKLEDIWKIQDLLGVRSAT